LSHRPGCDAPAATQDGHHQFVVGDFFRSRHSDRPWPRSEDGSARDCW
jgi:hypothetical protein